MNMSLLNKAARYVALAREQRETKMMLQLEAEIEKQEKLLQRAQTEAEKRRAIDKQKKALIELKKEIKSLKPARGGKVVRGVKKAATGPKAKKAYKGFRKWQEKKAKQVAKEHK